MLFLFLVKQIYCGNMVKNSLNDTLVAHSF